MSSKLDQQQIIQDIHDTANQAIQVNVVASTGLAPAHAEDDQHNSGDLGNLILAVRNDAGTPLAGDGNYIPLMTDANGALVVAATVNEVATAADGGALPALTKVVSGYDGTNVQVIKTDAQGELQVDVLSSALPTGAATEATLSSIDGKTPALGQALMAASSPVVIASDQSAVPVTATDLDIRDLTSASDSVAAVQSGTWNINNISGTVSLPTGAATEATLASVDGKLGTLGQKTMAGSAPVVLASDQSAIPVTDNGGSITVDGSVTVSATDLDIRDLSSVSDSVSAVQSGTWNINDVSGVISLPTGAATAANQTTGNTSLSNIDGKLPATLGQKTSANSLAVVLASDQSSLSVTTPTLDVVDLCDTPLVDATTINGSAGAFTQVVASLAADVKKIQIADTSGSFIGVYTGPASSEALKFIFGPGSDSTIDVNIPSGTRISLRSMEASAPTSGSIVLNFIG